MYVPTTCIYFTITVFFVIQKNVKCKLVKVHCDRYAFNLKISIPFLCDDSYIHIQCIYKYLQGHVLLYQKDKNKMAAVYLWLIENKSLQI